MDLTESKIFIKNTLTGEKELFTPIVEGRVGLYVCGPTVYGEPHLGHARSAITFDVVYRYFRFLGYKVRYVRNITDVGHLEDEVNEQGEDKIVKKARLEQLEPMEVAQYYTNMYREMMTLLNVLPPSIEPTASGHIPDQIQIIERILENELAYEVNGSVYFDVKAYANRYHYGELSGKVLDELKAMSRDDLEGSGEKRFHADFALWKKASPEHLMKWDSPWSIGFPGWHIECTAMSSKYLGTTFDIHGGGMDLKFPHHEAEICQSLAAFDQHPANYWMHNNMVTLDNQKMAKSKGNFISLDQLFTGNHELLEKAYSPMAIRFLILQAHYSSPIDFSNAALKSAESACHKLLEGLSLLQRIPETERDIDEELSKAVMESCKGCYEAMNNDFNTAETIAHLFALRSSIQKLSSLSQFQISLKAAQQLRETYSSFLKDVLGLEVLDDKNEEKYESVVNILMEIREQARIERNFNLSDQIRDKLQNLGIKLTDKKHDRSSSTS